MNTTGWRNTAVVLAVVCVLLGVVGWKYVCLGIEVAFASDQSAIFDDLREQALASHTPDRIREFIDGVETYYPSGTKQRTGSAVDRIVERHRAAVLREMRAHLDQVERSQP